MISEDIKPYGCAFLQEIAEGHMAGNKLLLSKLPCDRLQVRTLNGMITEFRETILKKETVYQGILIRLEHWDVALPNGEICKREAACHNGAAAVVALDGDGQIILVRQSRVAVGRITREIPAGKSASWMHRMRTRSNAPDVNFQKKQDLQQTIGRN